MAKRVPVNVHVTLRRNETPEHLVKRFMKKVKNERIVEEYREKEFYEIKALYQQQQTQNAMKQKEAEKNIVVYPVFLLLRC